MAQKVRHRTWLALYFHNSVKKKGKQTYSTNKIMLDVLRCFLRISAAKALEV